jgi:hypothetical protein
MITPDDFKLRFPTVFDAVDNSRVQLFIDLSALEISESQWGNFFDEGMSQRVAHVITVDLRNATSPNQDSGTVTSKSIGKIKLTYATGAQTVITNEDLKSTGYGKEFLRLSKMIGAGAIVV